MNISKICIVLKRGIDCLCEADEEFRELSDTFSTMHNVENSDPKKKATLLKG